VKGVQVFNQSFFVLFLEKENYPRCCKQIKSPIYRD
jgi:hypothetical protein